MFSGVAATESDPLLIQRQEKLEYRPNDIRSYFGRDYTRILHCLAYRRLKHKTQVFFNTCNDHVCTRLEHVYHVESVSFSIARHLGLNTELTKAIAVGHDLGHAPFGHEGEKILNRLSIRHLIKKFWHEQNGLRFVDNVELLENSNGNYENLKLTYAVRDGIISHCGEIDNKNNLKPRSEHIDLKSFTYKGPDRPFTWEACVVKIADKIAYLGRDIEDAILLKFLSKMKEGFLKVTANKYVKSEALNTTTIMHKLITNLCENSNPDCGLCFSENYQKMIDAIKKYNTDYIYNNKRLDTYKEYSDLIITRIFYTLSQFYGKDKTFDKLNKQKYRFPKLISEFYKWLVQYCDILVEEKDIRSIQIKCNKKKIYGSLETESVYIQSIIDFIAGMTDQYAVTCFEELIKF